MLKTRVIAFFIIASLAAVPLLMAQGSDRGQIQGVVTDKSGAVVPGVTITIKNLATGVEAVLASESNGAYRFPQPCAGQLLL
jgi:hypothetical protein